MAIQIIQSIAYANLNEVVSFYPFTTGKVNIEVTGWHPFPMHPASGDLDTSTRTDGPGTTYNSTISARLKNDVQLPDAVILLITLCSGKQLILGSPDIPVRTNKNMSLSLTTLSVSYASFNQPLELI